MGLVQEFLVGVQSLMLPATCAGCGLALESPETCPLCPDCLKSLPRSQPPWCKRCGRSLVYLGTGVEVCVDCRKRPPAFDQAISPCPYEGAIREFLVAFKYQGRFSLAPFLAELLAEAVRERLGSDPADGVVPVPLFPTRLRERTFNQAQILAQALASRLGLPCIGNLLTRQKPTPPQTQLRKEERLRNVQGAFELKADPRIHSLRILLVDDVFTTGATVNSCAKLLKEGGASRVIVVTVAHG